MLLSMNHVLGWGSALLALAVGSWAEDARAQDAAPPAPAPAPQVVQVPGAAPTNAGSAVGQTGGEWGGLYNGRTLGHGGGLILAEAGWPGGTAGFMYGLIEALDLGVKATGMFAPTMETDNFNATFGLDLRAIGRISLVKTESFSLLARIEPGFKFLTFNDPLSMGPIVGVGIDAGIRVVAGGTIYLGLEVPMYFQVAPTNITIAGANFPVATFEQFPILPGAGFEYHFNDYLGIGARANAGPSIVITNGAGGTTGVNFAFIGTGYFVFRWDRVK
jgi:hypothetical protein